jgi:hypothetical protein
MFLTNDGGKEWIRAKSNVLNWLNAECPTLMPWQQPHVCEAAVDITVPFLKS